MKFNEVDADRCKEVLGDFIEKCKFPAFGTMPKRELDILIFQMMQKLGLISPNPTIYELVEKLRVTRSRASSLIYDSSLRTFDRVQMEQELKRVLTKPVIKKDDENNICFEIENPLLSDYLRQFFRERGYALDGSFSPSLIKLSHEMVGKLLLEFIPEESKKDALKRLQAAGLQDKSPLGIMTEVLKQVGKNAVGELGGQILGDYFKDSVSFLSSKVGDCISAHKEGSSK